MTAYRSAAALLALSLAAPAWAVGETATATLRLADGKEIGTVLLTEAAAGVLLKFDLKGLPPGPHAVRVYETGKCEGDLSSAGNVYNPLGAKHGFLNDEGPMAGDLPNIYAAADGSIASEVLSPFLTLSTEAEETLFDADGTAIVISEKPDDYQTEPDGAAGPRLACGIITIKK